MGSEQGENSWKTGMGRKWEAGTGMTQWKMPDEGYDFIIQIKFYSVMLLGNVVGPFCTALLKQAKLSNRAVTIHQNTLIQQSRTYVNDGAIVT